MNNIIDNYPERDRPASILPSLRRSLFHILREQNTKASLGFTFLELIVVVAVLGTLTSISIPTYYDYLEKARVTKAIAEIRIVGMELLAFQVGNQRFPVSLNEIKRGSLLDPWGKPYQYVDVTTEEGAKDARKDHNLHPINTDFDLYSMGKDGDTQRPLTAKPSHDDIISAWDGRYIGIVSEYQSGKDESPGGGSGGGGGGGGGGSKK